MLLIEKPHRLAEEQLMPEKVFLTADEDCEDMVILMFYMEEAA